MSCKRVPTRLSVSARNITLKNAAITAESTGNVAASDIELKFSERLLMDLSGIDTLGFDGDAGDIRIAGDGLMRLRDSVIGTSVMGRIPSGDGGNIAIRASALLMDTGFIQANVLGIGEIRGDVTIDVKTLVASGGSLIVAGTLPAVFQPGVFGLNVLQSATPTGVSVTVPVLDITGLLSRLKAEMIDYATLRMDLCRVGTGSSLTPIGRGGLRPSAGGLIRPRQCGEYSNCRCRSTVAFPGGRRTAGSVRRLRLQVERTHPAPQR